MKKYLYILIIILPLFISCSDDNEVLVPVPDDVTLNELSLDFFSYIIPQDGFTSDVVTFNTVKESDGSFSGFAYSNRNNRSFTWLNTEQSIDTNLFSVYTTLPNRTETFAVVSVKGDDAYFTLDKPYIVQHILVANTTLNLLALDFGSEDSYYNPHIVNYPNGVWNSNVPGVTAMWDYSGAYFKLIIKGYNGNSETGSVDFYLCTKGADPANPNWNYVLDQWMPCDLTSLGEVDKVVFYLESSDVDGSGNMLTPSYFCLDGIRLER